jgi:hypothetical protein
VRLQAAALLVVISPRARVNHVDHTLTDQTSVIHFMHDNWLGGERIGDAPMTSCRGRSRECSASPAGGHRRHGSS